MLVSIANCSLQGEGEEGDLHSHQKKRRRHHGGIMLGEEDRASIGGWPSRGSAGNPRIKDSIMKMMIITG